MRIDIFRPFVRSSVRPSVTNRFFISSLLFSLDSSTSYTELGYIYQSYQALISGSEGDLGLGGAGYGFTFGKIWQRR